MYSVKVPKDCEDELEFIREKVSMMKEGPERSFLLQCANWKPSEFHKKVWIPFSPIHCHDGYWPIYSIDLEYCDESENSIEFHSWKGDYDSRTIDYIDGNLDQPEETYYFKGRVWTRGE